MKMKLFRDQFPRPIRNPFYWQAREWKRGRYPIRNDYAALHEIWEVRAQHTQLRDKP